MKCAVDDGRTVTLDVTAAPLASLNLKRWGAGGQRRTIDMAKS